MSFVFAVAPHHPLTAAARPISDTELLRYRAVAVADSAQRLAPLTVNLLPGQDVLTVGSMQVKLEVQLRGLACGFVPEPFARAHIAAGRLVALEVERPAHPAALGYARRIAGAGSMPRRPRAGLALRWWLGRLESTATRTALLERHGSPFADRGL